MNITEKATEIVDHCPGLRAYTTPKGIRTVELDYWADPAHDEAWARKERKTYASEKDWRREMRRDWSSPSGEPYFPAFLENGGRNGHVRMARKLIAGAVFRSHDTGRRRPACTWFQYSRIDNRIFLMREFMPHDLLTHEYRDAVRYFSGQLPLEDVPARAQLWIARYLEKPTASHCSNGAWFPPGVQFFDIVGKEAEQGTANTTNPAEVSFKAIFEAVGMQLFVVNPKVLARNRHVGSLLRLRRDGLSGLIIDPQCEQMIAGFEGAFTYPKATEAVPVPSAPKDDGNFINLLDAFGYGVCAVVPPDDPKTEAPSKQIGWSQDGRTPIMGSLNSEDEGMNLYENRRQR